MGYLKQIVVGFILVAVMILAVKLQVDLNELNQEYQALKKQRDDLKYQNEKLLAEKEEPLDEEAIAKKAEEMGYADPNTEYYYIDSIY